MDDNSTGKDLSVKQSESSTLGMLMVAFQASKERVDYSIRNTGTTDKGLGVGWKVKFMPHIQMY